MKRDFNRSTGIKRRFLVLLAGAAVLSTVAPVAAADTAAAPDSFNARLAATGVLIEASAPAVVPLDVLAGISHAQVDLNSQPRIQSTAAPVFVPLAQDASLLGGTSGLLAIVVRLAPGLIVGVPTLFGLDPLPIDPSAVPVGPVADALVGLPLPGPPPLGCTSNFPDEPREAECGGGAQDFFGYRVGAGSARTTSSGELGDPSSLSSRSDASAAGIRPAAGNAPLLPLTLGSASATALSHIKEGHLLGQASAAAGAVDIAGQLGIDHVEARFVGALDGTVEQLQQHLECVIEGANAGGEEVKLGTDTITLGGDQTQLPGGNADGLNGILGQLGGEVGPADFGYVQVTPNPAPVSEVSDDGTSIHHRFGCLEIRYRNLTSGTDVKLTLGNIDVTMSAFRDAPLPAVGTTAGDTTFVAPTAVGTNNAGATSIAPAPVISRTPGLAALPDAPTPGSGAPAPAADPFLRTSSTAGWGIDGTWLAPYCLLALALPFLVKSRRFTILDPRR